MVALSGPCQDYTSLSVGASIIFQQTDIWGKNVTNCTHMSIMILVSDCRGSIVLWLLSLLFLQTRLATEVVGFPTSLTEREQGSIPFHYDEEASFPMMYVLINV